MNAFQAIVDAGVNRQWLTRELYRRAAWHFEKAGEMLEAAECWGLAREHGRAAEIYLEFGKGPHAAPQLLAAGRYEEALACYRDWLAAVPEEKADDRVSALLGESACLRLMKENPGTARKLYRQAREIMESGQPSAQTARCWAALGEYGVVLGRNDLIHIGFEKALAGCPENHHEFRLKTAKRYLKSVTENRLLTVDIQRRIAEWTPDGDDDGLLVKLRKEPQTISDDEIIEKCGLRLLDRAESGFSFSTWKPVEYIKNDFKDQGEIVFDRTTGLIWSKKRSDNTMNYERAGEYVSQLNQDRFAGYSDWRLPTIDELASLLEPEKGSNGYYLNSIFERGSSGDYCWTADQRAGGGAWDVNFSVGDVNWVNLNDDECVRVCRP